MPNGELNGQVALVTGATRGIGRAIAIALADAGARVIGTATTDEGAQTIASNLHAIDRNAEGARLDVRDAERIDALVKDIDARHGPIGILVNNAGITRDNLLVRMKDDDLDDIIATNLKPAFRLAKSV